MFHHFCLFSISLYTYRALLPKLRRPIESKNNRNHGALRNFEPLLIKYWSGGHSLNNLEYTLSNRLHCNLTSISILVFEKILNQFPYIRVFPC